MGLNKARGQSEANQLVKFKILDTGGTPTIVNVSPLAAAGDITITDTGVGIYDVVIKNFQGQQQVVNVQATAYVIGNFCNVTARSYSGADLSLTIKTGTAATDFTAADSSVDVAVEAF
jgi:hypothetical protein